MKPSLIPGDNILVNKMVGGARLFDVFAALNKEEIDIHRLPGLSSFKRNDMLVFNFPYPARWDSIGFDVIRYYVKRCIALPGDTLEIRNSFFHIPGVEQKLGCMEMQSFISHLPDTLTGGIVMKAYPRCEEIAWTIKNFGPLLIPAKEMNQESWLLYQLVIHWEQKQRPVFEEGHVYLGDSLLTTYRFEKDYYFMAGDKMNDSQDSRYWGLLPEEFIVGRADYVWLSKDRSTRKIRWNRLMKRVQ